MNVQLHKYTNIYIDIRCIIFATATMILYISCFKSFWNDMFYRVSSVLLDRLLCLHCSAPEYTRWWFVGSWPKIFYGWSRRWSHRRFLEEETRDLWNIFWSKFRSFSECHLTVKYRTFVDGILTYIDLQPSGGGIAEATPQFTGKICDNQ